MVVNMKKRTKRAPKVLGPIIVMGIIVIGLMILSLILSLIGVESEEAVINFGHLEMSLVSIKNAFSIEGIKYILSNSVTNFRLLEPLALIIISLIATSIAERSGLIKHLTDDTWVDYMMIMNFNEMGIFGKFAAWLDSKGLNFIFTAIMVFVGYPFAASVFTCINMGLDKLINHNKDNKIEENC